MRKSRAARNRRVRTNGLVSGRKYVDRKVYNVTMGPEGYLAVALINDEVWRVEKRKHAKSWNPIARV